MIMLNGVPYLTSTYLWRGDAINRQAEEDRLGLANLEFTAAKLLRGAGAGVNPTEIDVPTTLTVAETEVFTGTSPASYTDLDLSSVVGAKSSLVLLKITVGFDSAVCGVRKNGDTDDQFLQSTVGFACGQFTTFTNKFAILCVITDASGIIEWRTDAARTNCTIDVIAYIN